MVTAQAGETPAGRWTVHTSWAPLPQLGVVDVWEQFPDWPAARRSALKLACLAGVRYVSVVDPQHTVAGDYDRFSGRWRTYALPVGVCGNESEPDGQMCGAQLYARPGQVQTRCWKCGGWTGCAAPGIHRIFDCRVAD